MAIDYKDGMIYVDGVAAGAIGASLEEAGMEESLVSTLIGHMLVGYVGGSGKPAFRFTTNVRQPDGRCEATFERGFEHLDWVDGVSRVQAGMTPEELGFNARFHAIESDIDAIAGQFDDVAACTGRLRSDLVGIVNELEAKLTDLDRQIHALKGNQGGTGPVIKPGVWEYLGTATVGEKPVMVTRLADQIRMAEIPEAMVQGGKVVNPPRGSGVLDNLRGGTVVLGTDGVREVTPDELVINPDRLAVDSGRPLVADDLVRFTTAVEDRVSAEERSIADIRAEGDVLVRTLTEGLDESTSVTGAALVNLVTERVLAGVPESERTVLKQEVLRADAASRSGNALLSSGVAALSAVTETEAETLSRAGFSRIGALANATTADVVREVSAAGGTMTESQVQAAIAGARVARALRG